MITLRRCDAENSDFIALVKELDAGLAIVDGEDHAFYSQFNRIENIKFAVLAYDDGIPAGCGAIKEYEPGVMEIKRMFVRPDMRRKGIAATVLAELERWAAEFSCSKCLLETGLRQPEAIALYRKSGYLQIPNYGQYKGVENSVCFEKHLLLK